MRATPDDFLGAEGFLDHFWSPTASAYFAARAPSGFVSFQPESRSHRGAAILGAEGSLADTGAAASGAVHGAADDGATATSSWLRKRGIDAICRLHGVPVVRLSRRPGAAWKWVGGRVHGARI